MKHIDATNETIALFYNQTQIQLSHAVKKVLFHMKTGDESVSSPIARPSLPSGQHQARTRWGTQASIEAFDRWKFVSLTEQARTFIAQQSLCMIAGRDSQNELCGLLVLAISGFVQTPDEYICLLRFDSQLM